MSEKRKVALYIRVAQKDDEIAKDQETTLRGYAEEHGYRNVLAYVDNGFSGLDMNRPALNRLQEDIAAGMVSRVIVKDISRVSRSFLEVPGWINSIRRYGVSFTSVQDSLTEESFEAKDTLFQLLYEHLEGKEHQPL